MTVIFHFMYDHGVHGLNCVGFKYFLTLLDLIGLRFFFFNTTHDSFKYLIYVNEVGAIL